MNELSFGQMIKKRRHELKLTTYDLAHMVDVSNAYISKIENGERHPSKKVLFKLTYDLSFYELEKKKKSNVELKIVKNKVDYGDFLFVYSTEKRISLDDLKEEFEEYATLRFERYKTYFDSRDRAVAENRIIIYKNRDDFYEIEKPYFDLEWLLNQNDYEILYGNEYDVRDLMSVIKDEQVLKHPSTRTFNKLKPKDIKLIREVIETIISNKYNKFPK